MEQANKLPVVIIIGIVAINSLGIGLILPVMPELLRQVGGVDIARAAAIGGMLALSFASMQVLFGPLLGALSDRFGRRSLLMTSLFVNAIDYLVLAVGSTLWLFFFARLLSGISSATLAVANSALADRSDPEQRAKYFGFTSAAFGLGFVLGPVVGGLLGNWGPRAPFFAAALLCAITGLLAYFFLPETLAEENRRKLQVKDCVPFIAFVRLRQRLNLVPLVVTNFLDTVAGVVYPAVWAFFAIVQFQWSTTTVGFSLAAYGFCMVLVQAGLVSILVDHFGDIKTATLGLTAGVLGFLILSVLESGVLSFLFTPLFALRAITNTALVSRLSQLTPDSRQGEIQGILTAVTGIATLVGIPLMTQVFAAANHADRDPTWPGAPFAVAAGFTVLAFVILRMPRMTPLTSTAQ